MLTVSPNGNPSLYSNYIEIKYIKKNLNNVLIKMLAWQSEQGSKH